MTHSPTPPFTLLTHFPSEPFVILDDSQNQKTELYHHFNFIKKHSVKDNPDDFLNTLEKKIKQGFWGVGYFEYEFGYLLDPALKSLIPSIPENHSLAWFGFTPVPAQPVLFPSLNSFSSFPVYELNNITPSITIEEYNEAFTEIKNEIQKGMTYEINLTFKLKFQFSGDIFKFYLDIRNSQPTPYSALIFNGKDYFLSFSPELFFHKKGSRIYSKPMKGTAPRGSSRKEDLQLAKQMKKDPKTLAENVMIVDLLRNDLGRMSSKVTVPKLFEVETYRTLLQMTSTVKGILKPAQPLSALIRNLFPCGSITGAPKISSMNIIQRLEKEPRGIYTGAIGVFSPAQTSIFNVAIRTVKLSGKKGELGIGGGIVHDSNPESEFEEALLKSRFLTHPPLSFSIFETLLWTPSSRFKYLSLHLGRLLKSCRFFQHPFNLKQFKQKLILYTETLSPEPHRIKIIVHKTKEIEILSEPFSTNLPSSPMLKLSSKKTDPTNLFLYHKTTLRNLYEEEFRISQKQGYYECIFLNNREELTEGCITNLFLKIKNELCTPQLSCGVLPGILRHTLLSRKKVKEKILTLNDLEQAEEIYVGNSLRGLIKMEWNKKNSFPE